MNIDTLLEVNPLPDNVRIVGENVQKETFLVDYSSSCDTIFKPDESVNSQKYKDLIDGFAEGKVKKTEAMFIAMARELALDIPEVLPPEIVDSGEKIFIEFYLCWVRASLKDELPPDSTPNRDLFLAYINQDLLLCECVFIYMLRELVKNEN